MASSDESLTVDYLRRIGLPEAPLPAPTLATLRDVVAGHNAAIPFETLDPVLGVPVVDLSFPALADKMITRRRGGYCFEQNGLLGHVLDTLGYEVDRLTGRVVWMDTSGRTAARTHLVLRVRVPGESTDQLVDVGFGGQTLTSPIMLIDDEVQQTRHEPYRLIRLDDHTRRLEALIRDAWEPLYVFTDDPQPRIDLEVGSWYVSTHPESIFVRGLSVARVTPETRWNLRGRNLTLHHRDGRTEKRVLESARQVADTLTNDFGLVLPERPDLLAILESILDS
jgi:arylamine N-acetyltransferase